VFLDNISSRSPSACFQIGARSLQVGYKVRACAIATSSKSPQRISNHFELYVKYGLAAMAISNTHNLCRTCRCLNLRIDTFIDTGWRYPTSLQYESALDIINDVSEAKSRHYIPGEHLIDDIDYTDEQLATKLKAPAFVPEFDEDDGLLLNVRPSKRKTLGRLADIKQRVSECGFCRFIAQQVEQEEARRKKSPQEPAMKAVSDVDECKIRFEYYGQGGGYLARGLMLRDESLQYGRYECTVSVGRYLEIYMAPLVKDQAFNWFGSRTYGPQFDFQLARRWLRACEGQHLRCGKQLWHARIKPISPLRLIDVQGMCLVDAREDSRYVALSYVWGAVPMFKTEKRLKGDLYAENGLVPFMDEISTTIQDAMQVVRNLGERFLWTDAICIIQDDWGERMSLIGSMDAVYAHAVLTLVAAEGTSANAGLPGLRPNLRSVPEVFQYGPDLILSPITPPLAAVLLNCPWSTRAWTFQEGHLSARMLVFTNNVVHFACNCTCWSEDLNNPSEASPPPWKYASGSIFEFRPTLTDTEMCREYVEEGSSTDALANLWQSVVGELSSRNLSYETDIMFAGAGMFHLLEQFFNIRSLHGLPEHRIEEFLFWSPIQPGHIRRRHDLDLRPFNPSWSWCGWVGEVAWMGGVTERAGPSAQEHINWMKVEPSTKAPPVSLRCNGRGTLNDTISSQDSNDNNKRQQVLDRQWPFLQFRTRTSKFRVSKSTIAPEWVTELQPYAWCHVLLENQEREGVYCITTCDHAKKAVGSVILDTFETIAAVDQLVVMFAVLSSDLQAMDVGDFAGQLFYNVLAIEMKNDVAERIGHGRILENFWEESDWEWKSVLLG
jgi:hypothetical protein